MYMKKSVISRMVIVIGAVILLVVTVLYGFTEIHISKVTCAVIWSVCIFTVTRIVEWLER